MELECAGMKGGLESGDKLAAEDTADTLTGRKKEQREEIQREWFLQRAPYLGSATAASSPCPLRAGRRRSRSGFLSNWINFRGVDQHWCDRALWIRVGARIVRPRISKESAALSVDGVDAADLVWSQLEACGRRA